MLSHIGKISPMNVGGIGVRSNQQIPENKIQFLTPRKADLNSQ